MAAPQSMSMSRPDLLRILNGLEAMFGYVMLESECERELGESERRVRYGGGYKQRPMRPADGVAAFL